MHEQLVAARRVRELTLRLRSLRFPDAERQAMRAVALHHEQVERGNACSWEEYKAGCLRRWRTEPALARHIFQSIDEDNFYGRTWSRLLRVRVVAPTARA